MRQSKRPVGNRSAGLGHVAVDKFERASLRLPDDEALAAGGTGALLDRTQQLAAKRHG